MKRISFLTAAFVLIAGSASAQVLGNQSEIVTPNSRATPDAPYNSFGTDAQQPQVVPVAPIAAPVTTFPVTPTCKLISVAVPVMPKDKPATYHVLVKDNVGGLFDELKTCNPNADVVAVKANSAAIKVTQANGQAYFKVPTVRSARLMLSFSTNQADWKSERFWDSAGPIGERTEVTLVVAQAGEQSK